MLTVAYEHRVNAGYLSFGAREIVARYPELLIPEDFGPDDWPYGEESLEQAKERAEGFVTWLRTNAQGGNVGQMAIVTHGAFTRLVLGTMLGVEPACLQPVILDNTSLCTLRVEEQGFQVLALNDTAHLAGLSRAGARAR